MFFYLNICGDARENYHPYVIYYGFECLIQLIFNFGVDHHFRRLHVFLSNIIKHENKCIKKIIQFKSYQRKFITCHKLKIASLIEPIIYHLTVQHKSTQNLLYKWCHSQGSHGLQNHVHDSLAFDISSKIKATGNEKGRIRLLRISHNSMNKGRKEEQAQN
jgi:hypothetical protein